jgi:hypothetical protein
VCWYRRRVILGLDAYSFDIVEPYVNQTAKDASERKLRAILAKLDPPPRPAAISRSEVGRRAQPVADTEEKQAALTDGGNRGRTIGRRGITQRGRCI